MRVLKLLSEDPANYADAPTEGIRRILEQVGQGSRGWGGVRETPSLRSHTDCVVPRREVCRCLGTDHWTPVALPASAWVPQWPPMHCWNDVGSGWRCS